MFVLVVSDDRMTREVAEALVETAGHLPVALSSIDAENAMADFVFDLLIVDVDDGAPAMRRFVERRLADSRPQGSTPMLGLTSDPAVALPETREAAPPRVLSILANPVQFDDVLSDAVFEP
jgi:CheY-like chemotaxis protein